VETFKQKILFSYSGSAIAALAVFLGLLTATEHTTKAESKAV
jgi:hypothetical protein